VILSVALSCAITSCGGGASETPATNPQLGKATISGTADGTPFSANGSYWLGAPDSADTTVVDVFSKPVACSDLATPGWDTRIPGGTQVLEMKLFGTKPDTFVTTTNPTPGPGEATVNYTLASSMPTETSASGGSVTVAARDEGKGTTGNFNLTLPQAL